MDALRGMKFMQRKEEAKRREVLAKQQKEAAQALVSGKRASGGGPETTGSSAGSAFLRPVVVVDESVTLPHISLGRRRFGDASAWEKPQQPAEDKKEREEQPQDPEENADRLEEEEKEEGKGSSHYGSRTAKEREEPAFGGSRYLINPKTHDGRGSGRGGSRGAGRGGRGGRAAPERYGALDIAREMSKGGDRKRPRDDDEGDTTVGGDNDEAENPFANL